MTDIEAVRAQLARPAQYSGFLLGAAIAMMRISLSLAR